jgi:hypothetical protein
VDQTSVKAGLGQESGRALEAAGHRAHGHGRSRTNRRRRGVALVIAVVVLVLTGCATTLQGGRASLPDTARGKPVSDQTLSGVESLYASDMVARINAERSARNSAAVPVPALAVDPGLQADAQAWSAQIAASGTVSDPTLPPCSGGPSQVCAFAANSGSSGYGFWPGDGSDGTDGDFMGSAAHRQNELGAAYDDVGVGVTCANNQAWTVEIFGYSIAGEGAALARQANQNALQGDPVPQSPEVASAPSGDPVYCPGQTYGPNGEVTATGGQYPYPYSVPSIAGEPGGTTVVGMASTPGGGGYWLARADGAVDNFGNAGNYGSMANQPLNAPITHIVATPDGKGYWLVAGDGGTFAFGDAGFYGSMGGQPLNAPVVDIAPTPDGKGYWLVASDGGIFSFGDATFYGSMGGQPLNQPVNGMAATPDGKGYWLVASDGGIFSFGDATFYGSMGGQPLNQPVNGMAAAPGGHGYWLVASDGGIFSFGDAGFHGSTGGMTLNAPIVGMATDPATGGYWLVGSDGGIFAFDAPFDGSGA